MSIVEIQARLDRLQQSTKQTGELIIKLSKSQSADEEPRDSAADIAADIRESLQQDEEDLELVKEDLQDVIGTAASGASRRTDRLHRRDSTRDGQWLKLQDTCRRLTEDLATLRAHFRRSNLQSKKNEELALQMDQAAYLADLRAAADALGHAEADTAAENQQSHSEMRTSLFANRRGGASRNNANSLKDDVLLTASSDLTSSLRRTHELLASELSRSRFAHETLDSSNAALKDLNEKYGTLDDLLSRSRGLLGSLLRSQKSDTWYLETTIYILLAVIGWLVFRRLLYGPLWWLTWLPLKFAWNIIALVVRSGTGRSDIKPIEVAFQSSTPLIINPSATGGHSVVGSVAPSIRVEGAGVGANQISREGHTYPMSDQVADIIESIQTSVGMTVLPATTPGSEEQEAGEGTKPQEGQDREEDPQQPGNEEEELRRGDGSILRDRDEATEPRNPKKRMFEEPPTAKGPKDEL